MSSDLAHVIPKRGRRRLLLSFLTVVALHGLLLLVPSPLYAVEFYDHGVMGGMQRFWDSVTWSKTWTTKNGTKIACGVMLIIPACAWD